MTSAGPAACQASVSVKASRLGCWPPSDVGQAPEEEPGRDEQGHQRRRREQQHRHEHELARGRVAGAHLERDAVGDGVHGDERRGPRGRHGALAGQRQHQRGDEREQQRAEQQFGAQLARAHPLAAVCARTAHELVEVQVGVGHRPSSHRRGGAPTHRLLDVCPVLETGASRGVIGATEGRKERRAAQIRQLKGAGGWLES